MILHICQADGTETAEHEDKIRSETILFDIIITVV